jgi:hypothetical protein
MITLYIGYCSYLSFWMLIVGVVIFVIIYYIIIYVRLEWCIALNSLLLMIYHSFLALIIIITIHGLIMLFVFIMPIGIGDPVLYQLLSYYIIIGLWFGYFFIINNIGNIVHIISTFILYILLYNKLKRSANTVFVIEVIILIRCFISYYLTIFILLSLYIFIFNIILFILII